MSKTELKKNMIDFTNPIKIGISTALIIFIYNIVGVFVFRKMQMSVKQVNFILNPFFSLIKFRHNRVEYSLGWLPLGGYVAPVEELTEASSFSKVEEKHKKLHLYNLLMLLSVFFILVFGMHINFTGFKNLYEFYSLSFQMVFGKLSANDLINTLSQKGIWNDFGFLFSLIFTYILLSSFFQLAGQIKRIGWVLVLTIAIYCLVLFYVHYKIFKGTINYFDFINFYITALLSSTILFLLAFLMLRNFNLQEKNSIENN